MDKTFNKPDLNAPRNRSKVKDFIAYPKKDIYGFFSRLKEQNPQLMKYSNKEMAGWIQEYGKQMAHEVATNRYGVKLPEGLGVVITGLCKPTEHTANNNIDYATSKKLGVIVPFRNSHTNDYLVKINYTNNIPRCRFTNHQLWKFKPVRVLSRAVSTVMKGEAPSSKYMTFTKELPVCGLFDKTAIARAAKRKVKEQEAMVKAMAEYDEFAFE
ncbi:MAG: hypothetical protein K9G49_10135 [Taibaiella sp.]|nr:hypothetical protein [Taibaiella sp.]